jgi:hypothetical protein
MWAIPSYFNCDKAMFRKCEHGALAASDELNIEISTSDISATT